MSVLSDLTVVFTGISITSSVEISFSRGLSILEFVIVNEPSERFLTELEIEVGTVLSVTAFLGLSSIYGAVVLFGRIDSVVIGLSREGEIGVTLEPEFLKLCVGCVA